MLFLEIIISILISVVANVITYYICKWLDNRNNSDNK
nr:MAG TPA: toxin [Caudoviricetes sp.]